MEIITSLSQLPSDNKKWWVFTTKTLENIKCDFAYFHPHLKFYSCYSKEKTLTKGKKDV